MSLLTTITPCWQRPEMLKIWLRALKGATVPQVQHLVYFVGEVVPAWAIDEVAGWSNFRLVGLPYHKPGFFSIGRYHNMGASESDSEWMMKLDLDALPNVRYFRELLPLLEQAQTCQWFNGGMVYVSRINSARHLCADRMPISEETYQQIMKQPDGFSGYREPAASNFICRRRDYLALGGSDSGFMGYGWEDYQQLFMLEYNERRQNPLPGLLVEQNVTQRCRDEISRPKARELWKRNPWLCLLHHWHPKAAICPTRIAANRKVLLEYIRRYDTRRPLDYQV